MRRQALDLEIDQHTALIGAPLLAKLPESPPAAMIGAADLIARVVNGATAACAQMRAGDTWKFLKLFGVNIEHDAAYGTLPAAPVFDKVHGQPPIPLSLHNDVLWLF